MVPFKKPPYLKRLDAMRIARQNRVLRAACSAMDDAMILAIDEIVANWEETDRFKSPDLSKMDSAGVEFYRQVLFQAYDQCQIEKKVQFKKAREDRKQLAAAPPKRNRQIEKLFKDRTYWQKILRRSKRMTEKLKTEYLKKLRKKFADLTPLLESGNVTPEDLKRYMQKAWKASRSRVDTIFRTETTNYFARSQRLFFDGDPEIIGFLFDSVRDKGRTDICRSRHGLIFKPGTKLLVENTPALHFKCRSHLIPLANTERNRAMLEDKSRSPSNANMVPLPPGWRPGSKK